MMCKTDIHRGKARCFVVGVNGGVESLPAEIFFSNMTFRSVYFCAFRQLLILVLAGDQGEGGVTKNLSLVLLPSVL